MNKLITSDKIYIGPSKIANAGRGVFARRDIKKGEIIETCPIIEIPKYDMSNLRESILVTYFFYFGKNKEQLVIALVLDQYITTPMNQMLHIRKNLKRK